MTTSILLEKMAAAVKRHPLVALRFAILDPEERDYQADLLRRQAIMAKRPEEVLELQLVLGHLQTHAIPTKTTTHH